MIRRQRRFVSEPGDALSLSRELVFVVPRRAVRGYPRSPGVRAMWKGRGVAVVDWFRAQGAAEPPPGWREPAQPGGLLVRAIGAAVRTGEGLSPGNLLSRTWRDRARDDGVEPTVAAYRRLQAARIVDGWIALCLALELLALVFDAPAVRWIAACLAALRVMEIGAVWSYAVLFERQDFELRTGRRYEVVALPRSLIHALAMIGEVTLCWALLANALRSHIDNLDSSTDALDYSMRTLTTVGVFGEAHGFTRLVVDLEPFVGLMFVATVLARLVSGLPQMGDPLPPREPDA